MADKQSRVVFAVPASGGSPIDNYRVQVYAGGTLVQTATGQPPLLITHGETTARTAIVQAHNAQGWSTPVAVTVPAATAMPGGGGDGGGTTEPGDTPGGGNSSGAVPTGEYIAPSGFYAVPLDGGLLFDVTDKGRGYTTAIINYLSSFDGQLQSQGFAERYLWPIVMLGLTNDYNVSATLKIDDVELETLNATPTATGTPKPPSFEVAYDSASSSVTLLTTEPSRGTYDSLLIGYAKEGDTEGSYIEDATLPVTIPVVPGSKYNFASYALIKDKAVAYNIVLDYLVPGGSSQPEAG